MFSICFIFGVFISLQARSIKDDTVFYNQETIKEMKTQLKKEEKELEALIEYKDRMNSELSEIALVKEGEAEEILQKSYDLSKKISQNDRFYGSGIEVFIRDSNQDISSSQNPNDFIVHDQDILMIINDLKIAGAEIISINNQVVKNFTEIKCSGATITVNKKTFGQPFVIRAIGDSEVLDAAIKSKEAYSYMISSLYGIQINSEKKDEIVIDGENIVRNNIYLEEA